MILERQQKTVVAHSVSQWLALTTTWIYHQVINLQHFSPIVFAEDIANRDQFPFEHIYSNGGIKSSIPEKILRKIGLVSKYPSYDRAVAEFRPAILHSHFGNKGWYDIPIAKKYRLNHVVTFYGYDVNMLPIQEPRWRKRYADLFARAGLFLCEGPHMASCLVGLGCPPEKVKVQRLGANLDMIPYKPRAIGEDGLVKILVAGTFREKKGIPYALEAVGLLKNKYPNIRITVIGDVTGQPREEAEKRKIFDVMERYDLAPITRMLGFKPYQALIEEAYDHHIFLSPSVTASDGDTEGGSPVIITELSASGMPIISTMHCDIPEVVKDGITGYLVGERDAKALADALECCINEETKWETYGRNARTHIEECFNIDKLIPELEQKYSSLL